MELSGTVRVSLDSVVCDAEKLSFTARANNKEMGVWVLRRTQVGEFREATIDSRFAKAIGKVLSVITKAGFALVNATEVHITDGGMQAYHVEDQSKPDGLFLTTSVHFSVDHFAVKELRSLVPGHLHLEYQETEEDMAQRSSAFPVVYA